MPSRGLQHDVNVLGGAWLLRRVIGGGVKIILHTNFILLLLPNSVLSINFCAGQIVEDAQRAALAGSRREHTRHETIPKVLTEALEKTSSSLCRSVRRESSCVPVCGGPPMRTSHRSGEDLPRTSQEDLSPFKVRTLPSCLVSRSPSLAGSFAVS